MSYSNFGASSRGLRSSNSIRVGSLSLVENNMNRQPVDRSSPSVIKPSSQDHGAISRQSFELEEIENTHLVNHQQQHNHQHRSHTNLQLPPHFVMDHTDSCNVSVESKDDTALSSLSFEDNTVTSTSDCGAGLETGSVAHLRGWLDDCGKQQHAHYQKSTRPPTGQGATTLEKNNRPKIPVPKPSSLFMSSSDHNMGYRKTMSDCGPNPSAFATSTLVKRLVDTKPGGRQYSTPIRIKPKIDSSEVQATNEGYASVAKLSAWLADDPTRKKTIKQIRRGANILAKSRTFDKGLENVIIEQNHIEKGAVCERKKLMEMFHQSEGIEFEGFEENGLGHDSDLDWPTRTNGNESASVISVSSKKEWLANAFKSKTDIETAQDEADDITAKAKQLWRQRTGTASPAKRKGDSSMSTPVFKKGMGIPGSRPPMGSTNRLPALKPSHSFTIPSSSQNVSSQNRNLKTNFSLDAIPPKVVKVKVDKPPAQCEVVEPHLDFKAARGFLVQRTKRNGASDSNGPEPFKREDFPQDEITIKNSVETDISTLSDIKDPAEIFQASVHTPLMDSSKVMNQSFHVGEHNNADDLALERTLQNTVSDDQGNEKEIHSSPTNPNSLVTEEFASAHDEKNQPKEDLKVVLFGEKSIVEKEEHDPSPIGEPNMDEKDEQAERKVVPDEEKKDDEVTTGFHTARNFLLSRSNSLTYNVGEDDSSVQSFRSFRSSSDRKLKTLPGFNVPPKNTMVHSNSMSTANRNGMPPKSVQVKNKACGSITAEKKTVQSPAVSAQAVPIIPVKEESSDPPKELTPKIGLLNFQAKPTGSFHRVDRSLVGFQAVPIRKDVKPESGDRLDDSGRSAANRAAAATRKAPFQSPTKAELLSLNDAESPNVEIPLVGFHAARNMIVKRAKQNGNDLGVVNKVTRRKAKFEKWSKEHQIKNPNGLLKPTWEQEEPVPGHYSKKFVDDVPPRKSIDQLP